MKDFTDSLVAWWREKTNGPLYFTYLVLLIGWNWRSIYALFFELHPSSDISRLEYFNSAIEFHILGRWIDPLLNAAWTFIPPTILTLLAIRYLPYINAWAHNWHLKHYFARKEAWDKAVIEYEQKQTESLKQRTQATREKKAAKTELERILTPEEKWEDEGAKLDKSGIDAVGMLFQIIYRTTGRFTTTGNSVSASSGRSTYLSPQMLARIDGLGVAEINFSTGTMSLTDKGRYFIRRLQEQQQI